jgi:hypothetical protein
LVLLVAAFASYAMFCGGWGCGSRSSAGPRRATSDAALHPVLCCGNWILGVLATPLVPLVSPWTTSMTGRCCKVDCGPAVQSLLAVLSDDVAVVLQDRHYGYDSGGSKRIQGCRR